jgi:hypothetical protein
MIEDDLQTIYNKVFQEAIALSIQYNPQKIAATYMAIACRIYKTVLKDEDYLAMMKVINDTPIEPYNQPTLH